MKPESAKPLSRYGNSIPYILIFFLALGLRGFHLNEIGDSPLFTILLGDAQGFDEWARELAGGNWIGDGIFATVPLYAYMLGGLYTLSGPDLFAVRCVQILIGSLSCVCMVIAGRYFFSKRAGILAGLILAVYPSAIFFDGLIQKAVLGIFMMAVLLAVLGRLLHAPSNRWWLICGMVLGAYALIRANSLVLIPVIVCFLLLGFKQVSIKQKAVWCILLVIGTGLPILPVAMRNLVVGGEFTLCTSSFGSNLYMGNNLKANGLYVPVIKLRGNMKSEISDVRAMAEEDLGRKLTSGQVQEYWMDKTIAYIRSNPGHWMGLMVRKWFLVWNYVEVGDTEDQYAYEKWSRLLSILNPLLHFGILCPLAVFGMGMTWTSRRRIWVLYALLLVYALSITLFFVFARYRIPLLPILILFASSGVIELRSALGDQKKNKILACLSMALVTAVAANWTFFSPERFSSTTFSNLGTRFMSLGKLQPAEAYLRESLHLNPDNMQSLINLGVIYLKHRMCREAVVQFETALKHDPGNKTAHKNLITATACRDVIHYSRILKNEPQNARAHNSLGVAFARMNRLEEAINSFKIALRINPDFPEAKHNLYKAMNLKNQKDH